MIEPVILVAGDAPDRPDNEDRFWARRILEDAALVVRRKTGCDTIVMSPAAVREVADAPAGYSKIAHTAGAWRWALNHLGEVRHTTVAYYWGANPYDLTGKGAPVDWYEPSSLPARGTPGLALAGRNAIRMARRSRGYSSTTVHRLGYWMAVWLVLHELGHCYGLPHAEPVWERRDTFMGYASSWMAQGLTENRDLASPDEWAAFTSHRDWSATWIRFWRQDSVTVPRQDLDLLAAGYPPAWALWTGPTIADLQFWAEANQSE